jgi:hypothetical protein
MFLREQRGTEMIIGAHALIYSTAPEETRKVLAKILGSRTVDAGGGWLIMALPPSEIAVHPTDAGPSQELYLMCDDLAKTVGELRAAGVLVSRKVTRARWGKSTTIELPGGGKLGLYEPTHPTALRARKRPGKSK